MKKIYHFNNEGLKKLDKDIVGQIPLPTLQSILILNYKIVLGLSFFEYRICSATSFLTQKDCSKKTLGSCIKILNKIEAVKQYEKSEITINSINIIKNARNCYIHNFTYHGLTETSNIGTDAHSTNKLDIENLMTRMGNYQDFYAILECFKNLDILYMLTGCRYPGYNQKKEEEPKYSAKNFKDEMEKIYGDDKRLSDLTNKLNEILSETY